MAVQSLRGNLAPTVELPPSLLGQPSSWPIRRERQQMAAKRMSSQLEEHMQLVLTLLADQNASQSEWRGAMESKLASIDSKVGSICDKVTGQGMLVGSIRDLLTESFHNAAGQMQELPFDPTLMWCALKPIGEVGKVRREQPDAEPSPLRNIEKARAAQLEPNAPVSTVAKCLHFNIDDEIEEVTALLSRDWSKEMPTCNGVSDMFVNHWSGTKVATADIEWDVFSLLKQGPVCRRLRNKFGAPTVHSCGLCGGAGCTSCRAPLSQDSMLLQSCTGEDDNKEDDEDVEDVEEIDYIDYLGSEEIDYIDYFENELHRLMQLRGEPATRFLIKQLVGKTAHRLGVPAKDLISGIKEAYGPRPGDR